MILKHKDSERKSTREDTKPSSSGDNDIEALLENLKKEAADNKSHEIRKLRQKNKSHTSKAQRRMKYHQKGTNFGKFLRKFLVCKVS